MNIQDFLNEELRHESGAMKGMYFFKYKFDARKL
jgi:hypothetical protein